MFEKDFSEKIKRIFDFKKVTYNAPSEAKEQECVFIQVTDCKSQFRDKRHIGKMTGQLTVFANTDKLPLGYFSKKIMRAKPEDVKGLFFYDFEANADTFLNIGQRTLSFVYLFDTEYDPNLGELTTLDDEINVGS